jgi:hypothetical protein
MQSCTGMLVNLMRGECALLHQFHDAETSMKERIHHKDWNGLDSVIGEMTQLADDLVKIENARHEAFTALREGVDEESDATFYQVVVRLPAHERDLLTELYRAMKFSVFGIQSISYNIGDEVRTMNDTVHDIIGELYPHRKGRLYTKSGSKQQDGSNPLLVDHEL